jgi:OOP family OmpA-OmpF porin
MLKQTLCVVTAIVSMGTAVAAKAQFYVGAQGGYVFAGPSASHISSELVNNLGYFTAATSVDQTDGGWRFFGGYQILPWLAVEGAYVDLGKASFTSLVTPPGTINVSLATTAWQLGLSARYEFVPRFYGYGRISAAWSETKASVSTSGFAGNNGGQTQRQTVPAYAVGLEYAFAPNLLGRLEYERMVGVSGNQLGGKYDTNFTSIGIRYNF